MKRMTSYLLGALALATLTACTSNPPQPEKPKFTAENLPDICKEMAKDRDGCESIKAMGLSSAVSNGMYNVCMKRVTGGKYAACPVSYEEAKKILTGK